MLPFGKQEGNELVALFAIGAGEEDDVIFVVGWHDQDCYCMCVCGIFEVDVD